MNSLASRSTSEGVSSRFPKMAGIFLGLGLGGFFDGIVLHQILQWHHMASSYVLPDTLARLQLNVLLDGLFHASTYLFTGLGLITLWRKARVTHSVWSPKLFIGTLLFGFGLFNIVEGVIDHHILGLHHVNETVPREQWIYWDLGFLIWGAAMLVVGSLLMQQDRQTGNPNRVPRST